MEQLEVIELNKNDMQQVEIIRNQLVKGMITRKEANRRLEKYKLMI